MIIRNCVTTQLSREDVSRLRFTNPVQPDPPPKVKPARRNDDGQASLRRELRHNPAALHAMAAQLGLPASAADELLQELFQSVGETPPRPALRRARRSRSDDKPAEQRQPLPIGRSRPGTAVVDQPQPPPPGSVDLPRAVLAQQRTAALRSEATRNADLRRRVAEVRLRDLSRHHCPWVRDGYQWFIRQQRRSAQPGTR